MPRRQATVEPIVGVRLIDLDVFRDDRGDLVALEEPLNLPFTLRRVLYMRIADPKITRANHATSSDFFITPIVGSAVMDVDNGEERVSLPLDIPDQGIWTRPGIFIRLRDFTSQTVLLVCASKHLAETRHYASPQPHLIDAPALT